MASVTAASADDKKQNELGTYRDTVESIGVAIVLAAVVLATAIVVAVTVLPEAAK
jgi:hypothetical protein